MSVNPRLNHEPASAEDRLLLEQLKTQQGFANLIGTSANMQAVYRLILKIAPKRCSVLIQGESGTGKELVARAIHNYSPWRDEPFIPIDCGGLTPTLIESEMFGHVRGAFTGATETRLGCSPAPKVEQFFWTKSRSFRSSSRSSCYALCRNANSGLWAATSRLAWKRGSSPPPIRIWTRPLNAARFARTCIFG
jgi:hypothetical protein